MDQLSNFDVGDYFPLILAWGVMFLVVMGGLYGIGRLVNRTTKKHKRGRLMPESKGRKDHHRRDRHRGESY